MRHTLIICTPLILLAFCSVAQPLNRLGHPLITNFTPEDYNGTEQVWCIARDARGVMYFGTNENGILEYDGKTWQKINIPENKRVNSLATGNDGTIYVGTVGDFGYLEPTVNGSLEFSSLNYLLNDSIKKLFNHIYKTYCHNGAVYFCSTRYIFQYKNDSVSTIPIDYDKYAGFLTFIANNQIYIGSFKEGLLELNQRNKIKIAKGARTFIDKNIFSILALDNTTLLVITDNGIFRYNPNTGESTAINTSNGFLQKIVSESIIPYNSIVLGNSNIGIGNVKPDWLSFFEITSEGKPINLINRNTGLQSNQVTCLFQDSNSPLWLTLFDGGLSKAEINSCIRRFASESGIDNIVTDIVRFNGTLYVSTFSGVFYLNYDSRGIPQFSPVKNITGIVWDLVEFKTPQGKPKLLAGSYIDGVFEITGNAAQSISQKLKKNFPDIQHNVFSLYQSKANPQMLYIAMTGRLAYIKWNGGWSETGYLHPDEITFELRSISEDHAGNLWLSSTLNGIHVITKTGKYIDFSKHKDLASIKGLATFWNANDSMFVLSSKGIYHYNYEDSSFTRGGCGIDSCSHGIYKISATKKGFVALCYIEKEGQYWTEVFEKDTSGHLTANSKPFKRLPNKWSDALFVDDDGTIWIGMSKEIYSYNPAKNRQYDAPYKALIRKVIVKDSLLFDGTFYKLNNSGKRVAAEEQQPNLIPELRYKQNALVINFAAPYFEREEDLLYSHYLEGSDEQTWNKWDSRTDATYTNLREGKYTFHVKAKNIYGNESSAATFSFEISPPWYRTIAAYFMYALLIVAIVWIIVKENTRRLIAEKDRLEQLVKERTAEVVAQKEEIEVQKEKIAEQNEEIKSSIQYASRIQNAILTPQEQIRKIFPESFILYLPRDIVSGDFYYITQMGGKKISVVADCTGHGVPGGFMSMLGMSFLTQIITQHSDLHAASILNTLRQNVIAALHQTSDIGGSKDGMDIAIYIFDEQAMKVEFAGANNPLIHISHGELKQIKGDKMPIGIHFHDNTSFTNNELEVKKGDVLYTFSDGYADQFGGDDNRKFMIKNLKNLLLEIHLEPMNKQRDILNKTLLDWHGNTPRIDDVVIMGVRI
ncbi:MAG: SpoIIE family protein phosphatase [Bacteroidales bacterium]